MNTTRITFLLLLACGLAACSSKIVRNEPPLAQITSWTIAGSVLKADLNLRNVNEEELVLNGVQLTVSLEDTELVSHQQSLDASIPASGFESVQLDMTPTAAGLNALRALEQGEYSSLAYTLEGHVLTSGSGKLQFKREGHIYPMPGRPGRFR